jgi:hypothetical protein
MSDNTPPRPTHNPTPTPAGTPNPPAGTSNRPPQTVAWLGTLATLALGAALYLGLTTVDDCGSPWNPDHTAAASINGADTARAACDDAFGNRNPLALTLLVVGAGSGIAALTTRHQEQLRHQPPPPPTGPAGTV